MDATGPEITVLPAIAERWDDLAELFERPGPRGGRQDTANCWCTVWRARFGSPEANRQMLRGLVDSGEEPGLLAYRDGRPVGWVSVAPREQFPVLLRSKQFGPDAEEPGVFVVSCFAVDRQARGQGVAKRLLDAAMARAVERGATAVEAFPAEPPDYKGRLEWFLDYGFEPVREAGKRTVVRYVPG